MYCRKCGNKIILLFVCIILFACGKTEIKNEIKFIEDDSGHKLYKNEDGIYVKNDWYEIDGDKYFFDANGYLQTDCMIEDEYLVDEKGRMRRNYWDEVVDNYEKYIFYYGDDGKLYKDGIFEIDGKKYFFYPTGRLVVDSIVDDKDRAGRMLIDKKGVIVEKEGLYEWGRDEYYVKNDGTLLTDDWKTIDGTDYYFNQNGEKVINGFALSKDYKKSTDSEILKWSFIDENGNIVKNDWVKYEDKWCYADENGVLLANEWKEDNGDEYYFGDDCYMVVNDFVDGSYYVDEAGHKIKSVEKNINGISYVFDANGKSNKKVILKTENANWKLYNYTDTGQKYISGKYYYETTYLNSESYSSYSTKKYQAHVIVESSDIAIIIRNKDTKKDLTIYSDVLLTVEVNGVKLISAEEIQRVSNQFLVLTQSQKEVLLNSLMTNNNKIEISITDYWDNDTLGIDYYNFKFDSTGFNEIYPNL